MEDLDNVFGIWHSENLPFSQYGKAFWNKALIQFFESDSYDQRIKFFKKHQFILDWKYHPYIGNDLSNVDLGMLLTELTDSLTKVQLSVYITDDKELMKWYLEREAFNEPFDTLSLVDKYKLVMCHIRFTFSVLPPYDHATASIIVFNRYFEEDILDRFPELHYKDMLYMMDISPVPDKKRQVETILKLTQEKSKGKAETTYISQFNFLDGYEKCITHGYNNVPSDRKISKDFVHGKNVAMFEIELKAILDNHQNINEVKEIKNKEIEVKSINEVTKKLKWKGTPSQFGYLIHELIEGGYLEKPTPHFTKDAKIYMELFDIKTTPKNLEREISIINNSLTPHNKKAFKIEPLK